MYIGRKINQLRNLPYNQWTLEELAYHRDTMNALAGYLNQDGESLLANVNQEINARGGLPQYGGDYDHPTNVRYD